MADDRLKQVVRDGLMELAQSVQKNEDRLNERHIHHAFSHMMQEEDLRLGVRGTKANFHPEWPTRKKKANIPYTIYRKTPEGRYVPADPKTRGRAGFLDFAVGKYRRPSIGIEFTLKRNWTQEEVIYDLLKLLDPALPFELGASLNILLSEDSSSPKDSREIESNLRDAYRQASQRLQDEGRELDDRELFFLVVEVLDADRRTIWLMNASGEIETVPPTAVNG